MYYNPIIDFSDQLHEGEKVKPICNIPDLVNIKQNYFITSEGRVFSIANIKSDKRPKLMTPFPSTDGYLMVKLPTGVPNQHQCLRMSRLVLYYFGEEIPDNVKELEANHKDGNILNNNISNLEWTTHEENMHHAKDNSLMGYILPRETVQNIINDVNTNNYTIKQLAEKYNTKETTISNIKRNVTYQDIDRDNRHYESPEYLTDEQVLEIYNKSSEKMDDEGLAKEYNVSATTIGAIRRVQYPYNKRLEGKTPIIDDRVKCDDQKALSIYNECKDSTLTNEEICKKYGIGYSMLMDIKFLRNSYAYLGEKYNIKPIEYAKSVRKSLTPEEILKIKNLLLAGKSIDDIAKIFNASYRTIYRVKHGEYDYKIV